MSEGAANCVHLAKKQKVSKPFLFLVLFGFLSFPLKFFMLFDWILTNKYSCHMSSRSTSAEEPQFDAQHSKHCKSTKEHRPVYASNSLFEFGNHLHFSPFPKPAGGSCKKKGSVSAIKLKLPNRLANNKGNMGHFVGVGMNRTCFFSSKQAQAALRLQRVLDSLQNS